MTVFITGATEGIGYELMRIFAEKEYDLILVARNEAKLNAIQQEYKGKTKITYYVSDLSQPDNAEFIYHDLRHRNIAIDIAINNAGFGTSGEYTQIDWEQERNMLQLNMISLAYFTKMFAHDMKARGHGRIMNVASTAAFEPVPYMAAYAATKAFVLSLSESVNFELKGTGVTVTTLCPGVTESKFHQRANTQNTLQKARILPQATAHDVAEYGYKMLMRGKPLAIHKFGNRFNTFMERFLPRSVVMRMAGSTTR